MLLELVVPLIGLLGFWFIIRPPKAKVSMERQPTTNTNPLTEMPKSMVSATVFTIE